MPILGNLVAYVMILLFLFTDLKGILRLINVYFWGTPLGIRGTNCSIYTLSKFLFRGMLSFMKLYSLLSHLLALPPFFLLITLPLLFIIPFLPAHCRTPLPLLQNLLRLPYLSSPLRPPLHSSPSIFSHTHLAPTSSSPPSLSHSMSISSSPISHTITPTLKKSTREHNIPSYLNDYICNSVLLTNLTPS